MNNLYVKGETIMDKNRIVLTVDNKQIINPTHEMLVKNGWELYTVPELTDEEKFEQEKQNLQKNIVNYDTSSDVNIFYMNDMPMWLDKSTRAGLMLRLQAEEMIGKENTTLWYDVYQFTIPLPTAKQLLYLIEAYASACYDNTQMHLATVKSLKTLEELHNYDYTTGYPEKLRFDF